jgi:hypothetical protein
MAALIEVKAHAAGGGAQAKTAHDLDILSRQQPPSFLQVYVSDFLRCVVKILRNRMAGTAQIGHQHGRQYLA